MADILPENEVLIIDHAEAAAPTLPVLNEDAVEPELPKGAVRQDDGSVLYALRYPCTIRFRSNRDGATREEALPQLHLHRLTGADMRAITAASSEAMLPVSIARSARQNEAKFKLFFDAMDAEDAAAAGEIVSSFLGCGRQTGR